MLIATAYLKPGEIQDFADQIGDIGNAAVGYDLKIQVRVEVGGDGKRPPDDVVAKLNARLGEASEEPETCLTRVSSGPLAGPGERSESSAHASIKERVAPRPGAGAKTTT